ncbi:MAG TPA: amidohydrolase family protein [Acidimicrobiales bacterium]|jgi:N-acyl-D-aspartate/D-glutamate deacylase
MLDVLITGGLVADGTGGPVRRADVGIREGRIVQLAAPGSISDGAARRVDADGLVVSPGFIDVHTHQDAQVFWDAACTPSPLHGATTVIAGNCGFSIAPLGAEQGDYLMRMLARVEGIPLETLVAGVPWNWRTTSEYLQRVEAAGPAINMGFMVGHSALRHLVMGADAVGHVATPAQVEAMCALLRDGLAAGGMGFSSSWATTHWDGDGNAVPSRAASAEELISLAGVLHDFPGTQLEFIPTIQDFEERHLEIMTAMALAAGRPLNWNVLIPRGNAREATEHKLAASDYAAARGARVLALSYPDVIRSRMTFLGAGFDGIPGWAPTMALPPSEKLAALADPSVRARLFAHGESPEAGNYRETVTRWADMVVSETYSAETKPFEGRRLGDIAAERGQKPFDAMCDIVALDDLRTGLVPVPPADDSDSWDLRVDSWRDPRVVLGASDAGAHLDLLATFDWATRFLALTRDMGVMPIEEAVHRITGVQADLYGLTGRGHISEGAIADLVLFDAASIGPGRVAWQEDLPGGAGRLYGVADGIERVLVDGRDVVVAGDLTGDQPGHVLRAGRDTR